MLKKNLLVFAFIIILAGGFLLGQWYQQKKIKADINDDNPFMTVDENKIINKENFAFLIPAGWAETAAPAGVSAMVANINEEVGDPALAKINFKTYYSVNYDNLGNRSLEEYVVLTKDALIEAAPGLTFTGEREETINNRQVYFISSIADQRGALFRIELALIKGNDDDVWVISFNVGENLWPAYEELFRDIINSFIVK